MRYLIVLSLLFFGSSTQGFSKQENFKDLKLFCVDGNKTWETDIHTTYYGLQFYAKNTVITYWLTPFNKGVYAKKDGLNYIVSETVKYSNNSKEVNIPLSLRDIKIDRETLYAYSNGYPLGQCVKYFKSENILDLFKGIVKKAVETSKTKNKF